MMRRVFTFGCSFTNYLWPTWADILGKDYFMLQNWAWPGFGNRAIAERVAEAHAKFRITPEDLVIVQWTSHLRHDWLHFRHPKTDYSNWRTKGSIYTEQNVKFYGKEWMNTFWDEKAYYLHTLNNMLLTQGLLDGIGCEWYMTSMTDQSKLSIEISGRTVDGEHADEQGGIFHVWEKSPELLDYRERIWTERQDKWVLPIMEVCKQMPDDHWWFKFDKNNPNEKTFRRDRHDRWMEPHPSVKQHAAWLLELKKALGEEPKLSEAQEMFVKEFIDLKAQDETYNEFDAKIKQTMWGFEPKYRGF
jgi:hypothetical protein